MFDLNKEIITRTQAKERGLKRFFTGIPCPRGHLAERVVSNASCAECLRLHSAARRASRVEEYRAASLKWRRENVARSRANDLAWRERNRERNLQRMAEWRARNPKYTSEWCRKNPGLSRAQVAKRRAALIQRTPAWADMRRINLIYDEAAALGRAFEVDHEIPLNGRNVSGLHVPENLRIIPAEVNRSKHNRFEVRP